MRSHDITVVKLGGSLVASRYLDGWLDALSRCSGRVVVVPGGGPFADAVRQAQGDIGFDDATAHHLALIAMEQFGRALASLRPDLHAADSAAAIRRVLRSAGVPVWLPAKMVLRRPEILPSWDVTSDSLAAWLAGYLGCARLVLVKHGGPFEDTPRAVDLAKRGIVDRAFPRFLRACGAQMSILSASAYPEMHKAAGEVDALGRVITLREQGVRRLLSPPWPRSKRRAGGGR